MRCRKRYLLLFVTCINVVVFVCVCLGGGGKGLRGFKLLHLSLKVPPPVFIMYHRRHFVGVGKINVKPRFSLQEPPPIC